MKQTCPCLQPVGNADDLHPYPSHRHRCLATHQPQVIAPATQTHFCLTSQHTLCPCFPGHRTEGILPDVRLEQSGLLVRGISLALVAIVTMALAGLLPWARAESRVPSVATIPAQPSPVSSPTLGEAPSRAVPARPVELPVTAGRALPISTVPSPGYTRSPADRPPDRIEIPSIGLDAPVAEVESQLTQEEGQSVYTWAVADGAVGFHRGTAYPGRPGNTVLSGHHNSKGEVFRYLVDVPLGAKVLLHVGQTVYPYVVSRKMILLEKFASQAQKQENARWIEPFPDERLTLVTCWPYDDNTHRLIVIAQPLALGEQWTLPTAEPMPR